MHVDHASAVKKKKKKGSSNACGWICSLWSGRASVPPLGILFLGLWIIAVDPAFFAGHQSIKNCGIWIDLLSWQRFSFWSSLSTLGTNFTQIFHIFSSSRISVCTIPTLTSNSAFIVSIDTDGPYPWNLLFGQSTLMFWLPYSSHNCHHPSQTTCLPWISYAAQNWCSIHARWSKSSLRHFIRFCGIIFSKFKTEFYLFQFQL